MGTQKNRLNETVLLSTQKQMFKLSFKKILTILSIKFLFNWRPVRSLRALFAKIMEFPTISVILLHAHPASLGHNFVSWMQSFYFSESQGEIVLQTCH